MRGILPSCWARAARGAEVRATTRHKLATDRATASLVISRSSDRSARPLYCQAGKERYPAEILPYQLSVAVHPGDPANAGAQRRAVRRPDR
jgi:hypothetical protein